MCGPSPKVFGLNCFLVCTWRCQGRGGESGHHKLCDTGRFDGESTKPLWSSRRSADEVATPWLVSKPYMLAGWRGCDQHLPCKRNETAARRLLTWDSPVFLVSQIQIDILGAATRNYMWSEIHTLGIHEVFMSDYVTICLVAAVSLSRIIFAQVHCSNRDSVSFSWQIEVADRVPVTLLRWKPPGKLKWSLAAANLSANWTQVTSPQEKPALF